MCIVNSDQHVHLCRRLEMSLLFTWSGWLNWVFARNICHFVGFAVLLLWDRELQNQQNDLCARPAWTTPQSDQSWLLPEEAVGPKLPIKCTMKTQIRLGGCPGLLGTNVYLLVLSRPSSNSLIIQNLSHSMTKPTKWPVRSAKTRISRSICPLWSESSLCTQWVAWDSRYLHADNEDSEQTGWMLRLIWVFAGCTRHFVEFVVLWLIWKQICRNYLQDTELSNALYIV